MFCLQLIRDAYQDGYEAHTRRAVRGVIMYNDKLLLVRSSIGDYKFPGGGVKKYEDDYIALKREITEETGYVDITVGPCIGTAFEQNIDNFRDGVMFQMDSIYYICRLNSLEKTETNLEDYEAELKFTPEFISINEAYEVNSALENKLSGDTLEELGMKATDWLDRETRVLKELRDSYVDKALWDIFDCGQLMKTADRSQVRIDGKEGHANFVTNYDKMIQRELKTRLLKIYPEAVFVGEEDEEQASIDSGMALIVDPIDGTTNFMKDYRTSCISVGITIDGELEGGIIYQPYTNEMFTAQKGKGAFCNGERISVSDSTLDDALVVFGTAPYYE